MTEHEHEQIHEQHEREADDLEREGQRLKEHIKEARDDWEAKKNDDSVPTAQPGTGEHRDEPPPEADITPDD
jgi:hypothetical protein